MRLEQSLIIAIYFSLKHMHNANTSKPGTILDYPKIPLTVDWQKNEPNERNKIRNYTYNDLNGWLASYKHFLNGRL